MRDAVSLLFEPLRGLSRLALVGIIVMATLPADRRCAPPPAPASIVEVKVVAAPAIEQLPTALTPIVLEHRWLAGQFSSPAEVDLALGSTVAAWEPFMYLFDAQPRLAIASPIYDSYVSPSHTFGRDEHGGIWLAGVEQTALRGKQQLTFTRDIYLLPIGSSFRGVVRR